MKRRQSAGPVGIRRNAFRTALIYALIGGAWIVFFDGLIAAVVGGFGKTLFYRILRKFSFITATAVALYLSTKRDLLNCEKCREAQESETLLGRGIRTETLACAVARLQAEVVAVREEERRILAQELHDEAGQALTALKIQLELVQEDLPEDLDHLRERIKEAVRLTGSTLERIRSLARNLRPPVLDWLGLNAALEDFCRDFAKRTKLNIKYSGLETDVPDAAKILFYRFLQEALTNAARHARAENVEVNLYHTTDNVCLTVEDDGVGFDPAGLTANCAAGGIGLLGMRERLDALGGSLSIESRPGKGTRLTARVPREGNV